MFGNDRVGLLGRRSKRLILADPVLSCDYAAFHSSVEDILLLKADRLPCTERREV
jgi:hypothetical protein